MSKRSRFADNSKRKQPVQQQRAEAARMSNTQTRAAKRSEQQEQKQRSPE